MFLYFVASNCLCRFCSALTDVHMDTSTKLATFSLEEEVSEYLPKHIKHFGQFICNCLNCYFTTSRLGTVQLCNTYLEGGGSWEMSEICPKTKSCPPLIKQKSISTPPPPPSPRRPHIMIILRLSHFLREKLWGRGWLPSPSPLKKVSSH